MPQLKSKRNPNPNPKINPQNQPKKLKKTSNWANTPPELLHLIFTRLPAPKDRVRLSSVCGNWLLLAKSEPNNLLPSPPPWLLSTHPDSTATFRSFRNDPFLNRVIPDLNGSCCVGSFGLWLFSLDVNGVIGLFNPLTDEKILVDLPALPGFEDIGQENDDHLEIFEKSRAKVALLSFSDMVFMVVYNVCMESRFRWLVFIIGGESEWRLYRGSETFCDVVCCDGKFYGVSDVGVVCEFDDLGLDDNELRVTEISKTLFPNLLCNVDLYRYLVACSGTFLQVIRRYRNRSMSGSDGRKIVQFEVFLLELETKRWMKMDDLGLYSLFVNFNTAVAVLASEFLNLEPNCVYFTDDSKVGGDYYGGDICIFRLADASINPHYGGVSLSLCSLSLCSPATWIIPTSK